MEIVERGHAGDDLMITFSLFHERGDYAENEN